MFEELSPDQLSPKFLQQLDTVCARLREAGDGVLELGRYHPELDPQTDEVALAAARQVRPPITFPTISSHKRFKHWLHVQDVAFDIAPLKLSGFHVYPPGSFMGWHTNADRPGRRVYATWCAEGNESFFRHVDDSGEIQTSWDRAGWTFRRFDIFAQRQQWFWHCVESHTTRISFGFREKQKHELRGVHTLRNQWKLAHLPELNPPNHHCIRLRRLLPQLIETEPVEIPFDEIGHKKMSKPDKRYEKCNPSIPGIVVEGMQNPFDRPFRMIDGKHRIHRLKAEGKTSGNFYVLKPEDVLDLIEPRYGR